MSGQSEFSFDGPAPSKDGLQSWRERREEENRMLARRAGLPLGHRVEVWLSGSVRLTGMLELEEVTLFPGHERIDELRLRIGRATFGIGQMESCVRIDS